MSSFLLIVQVFGIRTLHQKVLRRFPQNVCYRTLQQMHIWYDDLPFRLYSQCSTVLTNSVHEEHMLPEEDPLRWSPLWRISQFHTTLLSLRPRGCHPLLFLVLFCHSWAWLGSVWAPGVRACTWWLLHRPVMSTTGDLSTAASCSSRAWASEAAH